MRDWMMTMWKREMKEKGFQLAGLMYVSEARGKEVQAVASTSACRHASVWDRKTGSECVMSPRCSVHVTNPRMAMGLWIPWIGYARNDS